MENIKTWPPGHKYSPIPSLEDIENLLIKNDLREINFNTKYQLELIENFGKIYNKLPFLNLSLNKNLNKRYFPENDYFSFNDAVIFGCMILKFKPSIIIEIGSSFSTVLILDIVELYYKERPIHLLISPEKKILKKLLKREDYNYIYIIDANLQELEPDIFTLLKKNDLLFIDSSHVLKAGNDLYYLFFKFLPLINNGVIIHFHDIFFPFDYPENWFKEGRFWNEAYALRLFLAYNNIWQIMFFNDYLYRNTKLREIVLKKIPIFKDNFGGSIYITKGEIT